MLANYHMHTNYSDDSSFRMEDVVKKAISCGLDEICITDHLDCVTGIDPCFPYKSYEDDFLYCKEKYSGMINLKLGMEFGMQTSTVPYFKNFFKNGNFDFILMSCHLIEDKWFWSQEFQTGKTQDEYNQRYYEEILRLVNCFENYSVLGHLDVIRRYDLKGEYPFEKIKPVVEQILRRVISDGKGIEINTSCYRYRLSNLTPSREILKLYRELGGEIITIGTDSHCPEQVSSHIEDAKNELENIGFKYFCTFDKMKTAFHSLN